MILECGWHLRYVYHTCEITMSSLRSTCNPSVAEPTLSNCLMRSVPFLFVFMQHEALCRVSIFFRATFEGHISLVNLLVMIPLRWFSRYPQRLSIEINHHRFRRVLIVRCFTGCLCGLTGSWTHSSSSTKV